jgi:hypothetical protein
MTTDAFAKLRGLLKELFQIESAADLDFGIYRIMNQKRAEIERFIEEGLARIVDETLKGGAVARQTADAEELRRVTDRIKEDLGEYAINTQGELDERYHETRLGKRYLNLQPKAGDAPDQEQLKATIFNHLYTFFSRYYDRGDFLSRRRYSKRQKYTIPYNGEEVYLHWANADQYYVKTGEHFFDYGYKAGGDASVRFKVVAADVEQNNVKGDKRYFIPRLEEAAFDEEALTLTVPFEWRPLTGSEQKGFGRDVIELIRARNDYKHDRGPNDLEEIANASDEAQERMRRCMDALAFLADYPLRRIEDSHDGSSDESCKGYLFLDLGGNKVPLYPFIVPMNCPRCNDREIYFIDAWDQRRNVARMKSFERGHTMSDSSISDALSAWVNADRANESYPNSR